MDISLECLVLLPELLPLFFDLLKIKYAHSFWYIQIRLIQLSVICIHLLSFHPDLYRSGIPFRIEIVNAYLYLISL